MLEDHGGCVEMETLPAISQEVNCANHHGFDMSSYCFRCRLSDKIPKPLTYIFCHCYKGYVLVLLSNLKCNKIFENTLMKFLILSRFTIQIQTKFWNSYYRRVKSFSDPIKGIREFDSDFLGQSETFSVTLSTCIVGVMK